MNNVYNYKALDMLAENIDEYLIDNYIHDIKIKINSFEIKNDSKIPYLKYLLFKDQSSDILSFPEVDLINYSEITSEKIIRLSQLQLYNYIYLNNDDDNQDIFINYNQNISFKGFYMNNYEIHIFFDLTKCCLRIDNIYRKTQMWYCLIDEIINHNKICNFCIDDSVTNFFMSNIEFCFLKNINNENYELPIVGYIGTQKSKVNFTYTFGATSKDKNSILGPYYYFTDYNGAIRDCKDFKKRGIVRFILFLGKIKIVENLFTDENDDSEIKKERLKDINLQHNMEVLTMRISDHNGKWAQYFDSAFLGKIELDNGEYLKDEPIIVLKEYNQHIPLSYHYIDENENYVIM